MTRRRPELPTEGLFDFPLRREPGGDPAEGDETARPQQSAVAEESTRDGGGEQERLSLFDEAAEPGPAGDGELEAVEAAAADDNEAARGEATTERAPTASLGDRLRAGSVDLALHALALALGVAGALALGFAADRTLWPGYLLYLASFSFLYTTVPLAFWGRTPGMTLAGLRARDQATRPLTFGQTALRWVGGVLTAILLGLPLLLALGGRSLADRISGSETFAATGSGRAPAGSPTIS